MWKPIPAIAVVLAVTACSDNPPPASPAVTPPAIVLPADMPPLNCADFEPPPVKKPTEKFTGRRCTDASGSTRWIHAFYQCEDGRIWPVLNDRQPTGANRPAEPTGPEYDKCLGR